MRASLVLSSVCMLLGSCSLLGWDDDLEPAECSSSADCQVLEERHPLADDCQQWLCVQRRCEPGPRDQDLDGSPAAECAPDGAEVDCDDNNDRRAPALTEQCDGVDNDCDDTIDEETLSSDDVAFTSAFEPEGGSATQVDYAAVNGFDAALTAFAAPGAAFADALSSGSSDEAFGAVSAMGGPTDIAASRGVALAATGDDAAAVALIPAGCARVVLGTIARNVMTLAEKPGAPPMTHFSEGLPDTTGAVCAAATRNLRTPAIAVTDSQVLTLWVNAEASENCGSATAGPVLANGGTRGSGTMSNVIVPGTDPANELGMTDDIRAPALIGTGNGEFLVAFSLAGTVTLRHLRVDETGSVALVGSQEIEIDTANPVGDLTLAAGPQDGDTQSLALAYRQGCGTRSRVGVVALSWNTSSGEIAMSNAGPNNLDGEHEGERRPTLAFKQQPLGWLVAWDADNGTTLRARQTAPDGTPTGNAFLLLDAAGQNATELEVRHGLLAQPLQAEDGFLLFTYASADGSGSFFRSNLTCSE